MFGLHQMSIIQKPLKDANFLSIYVFVYNNYVCDMCLHARYSRCAKTWPSSYGLFETKNKLCGSCILMTKLATQTNYYHSLYTMSNFEACNFKDCNFEARNFERSKFEANNFIA